MRYRSLGAVAAPSPVLSYSPLIFSVPGRPVDLQIRVSVPATGTRLTVIVFSHGHGRSNHLSSMNGYAPLANLWAAAGFVVIQPTHLSSGTLIHQLADAAGAPFWHGTPTPTGWPPHPRPCSPSSARSTCSAGSLGTMPMRPPTRVPSGSSLSRVSPPRTYAPSFSRTTRHGRRRARR